MNIFATKSEFMSEAILTALMKLFALVVDIDEIQQISETERAIIRSFLSRQLSNELVEKYMKLFDEYLHLYHKDIITRDTVRERKRTSLTAVRILGICEQINEELEQRQKIHVIIQLIEYIAYGIEIREKELDFLQTVAFAFNIPEEEYRDILNFVIHSPGEIPRKENVLLINNEKEASLPGVNHIRELHLEGEIIFLFIPGVNLYVLRYHGREDLYLNGQLIRSGLTYAFEHGSSVRGANIEPIYYTEITGTFSKSFITTRLSLVARNVVYRFPSGDTGLQEFNLSEESGKLVGIMGGSGVGKSTLLNVLNGNLKPQQGEILVNGYDLNDDQERETLNGVIGFVPQDDLLIEDLTVYQNLYYNAKLCLAEFSGEEVLRRVERVLKDLDLYEVRNLKVGSPLSKVISGGQRKRVNIALELIREPSILFVDEPTSGLSSVDSEMVMNLLKEQVYKGKLVIVNIHQPSSDLYKMFDRVIFMDKGGYQIYYGNPLEAVIYFKTRSNHANAREDQCPRCGNVDPDQVLQIIEGKIVNEHGKLSRNRKVSPREWFQMFKEYVRKENGEPPEKAELPENFYSIPGLFRQLKIFFVRDLLSKLANRQYVLISLLEAPLLAVILASFTKYFSGTSDNPEAYVFYNNDNLPAYLLMSVIVFLFLGLTISSEEIIKDRRILQREKFLNLSRASFLHSKILIMFLISAIQSITYVLIGNLIFEIRAMTLPYWAILFTTACFANLLGLNISSGLNSVITIYILVPFLLIPQILLCGVIVKFDELHKALTNDRYVPVIGDLMTSRWAYEALTVEQFRNNRYRKQFFDVDQEISNGRYLESFLIPQLQGKLDESIKFLVEGKEDERISRNLYLLNGELAMLAEKVPEIDPGFDRPLDAASVSGPAAQEIGRYLEEVTTLLRDRIREANRTKNRRLELLIKQFGGLEAFTDFRNQHENDRLADILLNQDELVKVQEREGRLIRKYEPVFMEPSSRAGRAQLYAPVKKIGNMRISTPLFNVINIWLGTLLFYITLYFDVLRRIIGYFEGIRLRRRES